MVTLRDIADQLHISRPTVSYALSNRWRAKRIRPETRELVRRKAAELGYRPNHVARSLKMRVTKTIGILVPTVAGDFTYQMLQGIEEVLGGRYTFLLGVSDWDAARERQVLESFEERMVDGILAISAGHRENLRAFQAVHQRRLPIVQVEHSFPELATDVVESDSHTHGYETTRHLAELGHRTICFIRSPRVHTGTLARAEAYVRAMIEHGLTPHLYPETPEYSALSRIEFARRQMDAILERHEPPLGIVTNDWAMALGALQSAETHGLRCPQDVSICSSGPTSGAQGKEFVALNDFLRVRFTSVEWSIVDLGRRAAELLVQRIETPRTPAQRRKVIQIPARLVEGESTAPPGENALVRPRSDGTTPQGDNQPRSKP